MDETLINNSMFSNPMIHQKNLPCYDDNKELFIVPEKVKARHILIQVQPEDGEEEKASKREKAADLRERIVKGDDFAALAVVASECPSKARGGDLGMFTRGQMVPSFEEAAFSQEVGEIGPVVETDYGFHVIQV